MGPMAPVAGLWPLFGASDFYFRIFSKPRHQREEQDMATRDTMIKREFKNYVNSKAECPKPIRASEERGKKKLQKRLPKNVNLLTKLSYCSYLIHKCF